MLMSFIFFNKEIHVIIVTLLAVVSFCGESYGWVENSLVLFTGSHQLPLKASYNSSESFGIINC